ncbi:hypothetical protein [Ekhidna sp.]|uniref:hypothetical protein n=1 Tax=Ekhidna sp. TaxID=2608089 RepID=UPI003299A3F3
MGRIVITCYRPKKGKKTTLEELTNEHYGILREEGLVTNRTPIIMKSVDGCIIEVFEWKSKDSIDQAHSNPKIQKLWERYGEACDFEKPINIAEFENIFSEFEPFN